MWVPRNRKVIGNWRFVTMCPGIKREYLDMIFDPFKRLSHRKGNEPGLGLGLAISRKIVESYGGRIWCTSQLGAGTSFFFTLPKVGALANAESIPSVPIASVEPVGVTQPLARILLIDDNKADIELNRIMLMEDAKLHCDISSAHDGKEGFKPHCGMRRMQAILSI